MLSIEDLIKRYKDFVNIDADTNSEQFDQVISNTALAACHKGQFKLARSFFTARATFLVDLIFAGGPSAEAGLEYQIIERPS